MSDELGNEWSWAPAYVHVPPDGSEMPISGTYSAFVYGRIGIDENVVHLATDAEGRERLMWVLDVEYAALIEDLRAAKNEMVERWMMELVAKARAHEEDSDG